LFAKSAKSLLSANGKTQMGGFTVLTNAGTPKREQRPLEEHYKRLFVHLAEINAQEMFELMQRTGLVELNAKEDGDGSKLIGKSDRKKQKPNTTKMQAKNDTRKANLGNGKISSPKR
jgi:hypothetical protein